jgi:serine/threonine protein phosphatase PrpC
MSTKSYTQAFDIGSLSARGKRVNNEDRILHVEQWGAVSQAERHALGRLYVVADGVGGNEAGEDASKAVVEGLMKHYYHGDYPPDLNPVLRLRQAIEQTSRALFAESVQVNNDMRSTVVAGLVLDPEGRRDRRRLVIANVGDSPAILFRKGAQPRKLTQDHVKRDMSLSQAMGDEVVAVAMFNEQLHPDDIVVLCTDGLSDGEKGPVTLHEMQQIVRRFGAQAASRELVRLALRKGSTDNVSAIVIRNGDKPWPIRMLLQSALALIAVLLLGLSIVTARFVSSEAVPGSPRNPIEYVFGLNPAGPSLAPTSALLPTATPTATSTPAPPTFTPVPQPTQPQIQPTQPMPTSTVEMGSPGSESDPGEPGGESPGGGGDPENESPNSGGDPDSGNDPSNPGEPANESPDTGGDPGGGGEPGNPEEPANESPDTGGDPGSGGDPGEPGSDPGGESPDDSGEPGNESPDSGGDPGGESPGSGTDPGGDPQPSSPDNQEREP